MQRVCRQPAASGLDVPKAGLAATQSQLLIVHSKGMDVGTHTGTYKLVQGLNLHLCDQSSWVHLAG